MVDFATLAGCSVAQKLGIPLIVNLPGPISLLAALCGHAPALRMNSESEVPNNFLYRPELTVVFQKLVGYGRALIQLACALKKPPTLFTFASTEFQKFAQVACRPENPQPPPLPNMRGLGTLGMLGGLRSWRYRVKKRQLAALKVTPLPSGDVALVLCEFRHEDLVLRVCQSEFNRAVSDLAFCR